MFFYESNSISEQAFAPSFFDESWIHTFIKLRWEIDQWNYNIQTNWICELISPLFQVQSVDVAAFNKI